VEHVEIRPAHARRGNLHHCLSDRGLVDLHVVEDGTAVWLVDHECSHHRSLR
jgi:hypothetical protein